MAVFYWLNEELDQEKTRIGFENLFRKNYDRKTV